MTENYAVDPTKIDLKVEDNLDYWSDPFKVKFEGYTYHGGIPFSVPFITHIVDNLYVGGTDSTGLVLPEIIEHEVSLYMWGNYQGGQNVKDRLIVTMYDAEGRVDKNEVFSIASWALSRIRKGPTLIRCQAGLNRSNLIAAQALILDGCTPRESIDILREKRGPAVLCNQSFEKFLLDQEEFDNA